MLSPAFLHTNRREEKNIYSAAEENLGEGIEPAVPGGGTSTRNAPILLLRKVVVVVPHEEESDQGKEKGGYNRIKKKKTPRRPPKHWSSCRGNQKGRVNVVRGQKSKAEKNRYYQGGRAASNMGGGPIQPKNGPLADKKNSYPTKHKSVG